MIKVCDAIMGSGKSTSCINYMNENPDLKFIYISPYVNEAARITKACPALRFVEPKDVWIPEKETGETDDEIGDEIEDDEILTDRKVYHLTKVRHTADLIKEGRNVATTHQAFLFYTDEMLEDIRSGHYTLMIDEDLQIMSRYQYNPVDLQILIEAGYVEKTDDVMRLKKRLPGPSALSSIPRLLESRTLYQTADGQNRSEFVFWILHRNLIEAFDDVFVMTYLFEGQSLANLIALYHMPYKHIGIRKDETGYHFDENGSYVPDYVGRLHEMIHVCDHKKLNAFGENRHALSANWFNKPESDLAKLKANIYNYLHNVAPINKGCECMWTALKKKKKDLQGKGYTQQFVVLNKKATNDYADRHVLAYAANIFMCPGFKNYFFRNGQDPHEDLYALSTMIQWIWRSAIRNGEEIWIYVPSRRMRELLIAWIADVERQYAEYAARKGGDEVA